VSEQETLCPHCGQMTHTIMGACPNCGYVKEPRHRPPTRRAPRYPWIYDFPGYDTDVWGYMTWIRMIGTVVVAVVLAVFLFPWYYVLAGAAALTAWWWLLS
jgi:ribosomal protein L37E